MKYLFLENTILHKVTIQNNRYILEIMEGEMISKKGKKRTKAATYFPTPVQEQYHRP